MIYKQPITILDILLEIQKYENISNDYLVTTKVPSDKYFTVQGRVN